MSRFFTHAFYSESDAIVADVNSSALSLKGALRASMFLKADLAGTTPSFSAQLQTKDSLGNWHNVGTAKTITASGVAADLNVEGPFGEEFRIRIDVDVADANETYLNVDISVVFEYDPAA